MYNSLATWHRFPIKNDDDRLVVRYGASVPTAHAFGTHLPRSGANCPNTETITRRSSFLLSISRGPIAAFLTHFRLSVIALVSWKLNHPREDAANISIESAEVAFGLCRERHHHGGRTRHRGRNRAHSTPRFRCRCDGNI